MAIYSEALPVYISSDKKATVVYFASSSVIGAKPVRVVAPFYPGAEPVRVVASHSRGAKPVYKVDGVST
jgi:hypothetical protein